MSDHVVCIVQARLGGSRFPRKVLADIAGRQMIAHVLERAAAIPGVHTTIAAIPTGDFELAETIKACGFESFEGPEDDVLRRYALAAEVTGADIVVRITADCPLLDPDLAATAVSIAVETPSRSYQSYVAADGFTDGFDVEVFRRWLLTAAHREVTEASDREHVTAWMRRNCVISRAPSLKPWPFKLSVDTVDDLLRVRAVFEHLGPGQYSQAATLIAAARAGVWSIDHV